MLNEKEEPLSILWFSTSFYPSDSLPSPLCFSLSVFLAESPQDAGLNGEEEVLLRRPWLFKIFDNAGKCKRKYPLTTAVYLYEAKAKINGQNNGFMNLGFNLVFCIFCCCQQSQFKLALVFWQCKDKTWQHKNKKFRANNHLIKCFQDMQAPNDFFLQDVSDILMPRQCLPPSVECSTRTLSVQHSTWHRGILRNQNIAQKC